MDKGKSKDGKAASSVSKPPRIVSHLQSTTVSDGQPCTLRCSIKCK